MATNWFPLLCEFHFVFVYVEIGVFDYIFTFMVQG